MNSKTGDGKTESRSCVGEFDIWLGVMLFLATFCCVLALWGLGIIFDSVTGWGVFYSALPFAVFAGVCGLFLGLVGGP